MLRVLVVAALSLPPLSCDAQVLQSQLVSLAREWGGTNAGRVCKPVSSPIGEERSHAAVECVWRVRSEGTQSSLTGLFASDSGGSMLNWERTVADSSRAAMLTDSLSAQLKLRGLRLHECGSSQVPLGTLNERVWESADLLVYLAMTTAPDAPVRVSIYAADRPLEAPRPIQCHRRFGGDTPATASTRPGESALRLDAILDTEAFVLTGDSVATIVLYRTDRTLADSADVRRTLATRLGVEHSLRPAQAMGPMLSSFTAVLIIRPCYVDWCEPLSGTGSRLRSDHDFVFGSGPTQNWVPRR